MARALRTQSNCMRHADWLQPSHRAAATFPGGVNACANSPRRLLTTAAAPACLSAYRSTLLHTGRTPFAAG
jgi:hypothetical protein